MACAKLHVMGDNLVRLAFRLFACAVPLIADRVCGADIELSLDGDIRTPAAALAKARELRASGVVKGRPVEIDVKPGRYPLTESVVFTAADSSVRFRGHSARTTVFDGGRELKPFTARADGVWVTDVPAGLVFDQLWVGDHRAQRARSPNRFYHYMKDSDVEAANRAFFADVADIAPLAKLPQDELEQALVAVWQSWDMGYGRVESVDAQTGRLVMKQGMKRPLFFWSATRPRYALENVRSALDAPGEWFHDVKTGKLLYIPRAGESVAKDVAYVPVSTAVVTFAGDRAAGAVVRDVAFVGIGFEHTAFLIGPKGVYNSQAASNVQEGAIVGTGVEDLSFENCRIAHTGGHGLYLRNGCRRVTVRHSLVEDLGAGGIYFGGDNRARQKSMDGVSSHLRVEDSIIRHGGRVLQAGIGVWMGHARDCTIVHNEICDFFYTGVSLGWTWGYAPTVNRDNLIAYNRIHHIGQGALSDMGGVYTLGDNTGSVVRNNWIWEVNGYADNGSPAWGLYTDEGSHGFVFCDNLVEKCRDGAIHQHYGSENIYSNNLCLTFARNGVWRSRAEDHVTIRVMNNIFWWTEPKAGTYCGGGSFESARDIITDNNLYWCATGPVTETAFKGESWEAWRKLGHDAHGAIADPLFVDPAAGDWRLRPNSPALARGFKPFDWREAGVYKTDAAWRALSEERCWDAFEDAPKAPPYRREKLSVDFERFRTGNATLSMGAFAPLDGNAGRPGQIQVVEIEPAQGKKALKFIDAPDLSPSWTPIVTASCGVETGTATLTFAIKIEAGVTPTLELRDYPKGERYATALTLTVNANGSFVAGGRTICAAKPGIWHDVELRLPISGAEKGRWSVAITPRGGETARATFEKYGDSRFRVLKWIGFACYGATNSVWYLDDIKLDTRPEAAAPVVP
ncbi:MAG: right-handed parallel beta-helix repeat-containing protein [Kiritimatiellia bacterium]